MNMPILLTPQRRLWRSCLRTVARVSQLTRELRLWLATHVEVWLTTVGAILLPIAILRVDTTQNLWDFILMVLLLLVAIAAFGKSYLIIRRKEQLIAASQEELMRERREQSQREQEQSQRERELFEHQKSLWDDIQCWVTATGKEPKEPQA